MTALLTGPACCLQPILDREANIAALYKRRHLRRHLHARRWPAVASSEASHESVIIKSLLLAEGRFQTYIWNVS